MPEVKILSLPSMTVNIQTRFLEFLESTPSMFDLADQTIQKNESTLQIDLLELNNFCPNLYSALTQDFFSNIPVINKATQVYTTKKFNFALTSTSFYNTQVVYKIRDLKCEKLGSLLSFSGTVTRTTQVRPELISGSFMCKDCNSLIRDVPQEFKYTEPLVCPNHLCTNRRLWKLDLDESKFSNWQRLHVQENTDEIPPGSLPRNIDVIVRDDMVEKIRAGDRLILTGYLVVVPDVVQLMMPQSKSMPTQQGEVIEPKSRRNLNIKDLNYKLHFVCIHANYHEEGSEDFTAEEIQTINMMKGTSDLYFKLSQSLFPSIHGHYSIKNAILLLLAGGVRKKLKDGTKLRGDINILLAGDPGTAKSQFLKQTSLYLPRSVYTSGKSSSAAGLTASVVKDSETGEFTIEAGALMLSDNGICCIDEFDKMNVKDQVSIHEAMEQQTITISKAGINATLNARSSVLAAANPVKGRYDKRKTLRQNLNLSAPVMSRFDLYFVLIDNADVDDDRNIAMHVLNNHEMQRELSIQSCYFSQEDIKLYLRYIKNRRPALSEEAKEEIVRKYVSIRQDSLIHSNNYRMTVRHLESMVRLSEALAKLHCEEEVKVSHVHEAHRLIKSSVIEVKADDIVLTVNTNDEPERVINNKDYIRMSNAFIYLIKAKEPMRQEDLILAYLEENEHLIDCESALIEERRKAEDILRFLIEREGVLFESEGMLNIHPNYDA